MKFKTLKSKRQAFIKHAEKGEDAIRSIFKKKEKKMSKIANKGHNKCWSYMQKAFSQILHRVKNGNTQELVSRIVCAKYSRSDTSLEGRDIMDVLNSMLNCDILEDGNNIEAFAYTYIERMDGRVKT